MSDVAVLSALAGALVGGAASALGSYWVSKRQWSREIRAEIFRVLLPTVWQDGPDQPHRRDCGGARWDEAIRAAQSLGGRDAYHGDAIQHFLWQWEEWLQEAAGVDDEDNVVDMESDAAARAERERIQLRRVLSDYEQFLQRRLTGLARRRPRW